MKTHKPIPPRVVDERRRFSRTCSPETTSTFSSFPCRCLHEHDGGRYIGTDDLVIMRDPERNWVNCGTYRVDGAGRRTRVGLWISPGKHGRQIREKYFKQGKPCPVLISCGHDPLLFLAGGNEIRFGLSEYDYAARPPRPALRRDRERAPPPADAGARRDRARRRDASGRDRARRAVRRVHRLLRRRPERAAGDARASASTTATIRSSTIAPPMRAALGLLLQQVRDEGRHDLGRGRARRRLPA